MYTHTYQLTQPMGNNAFSYQERCTLLGKAEIALPSIKYITNSQDIVLWTKTVFEEVDHTWVLRSCTGLEHLYHLQHDSKDIYIVDNHNHALYFWIQYISSDQHNDVQLLHIDQHSDLNIPKQSIDRTRQKNLSYIRTYTNHICNIGNFIPPFLQLYPQTQFERIKSESQLLTWQNNEWSPLIRGDAEGRGVCNEHPKRILDIDLDFRAPEMSIVKYKETIGITQQLITQANLITIATSPYFIEQETAKQIMQDLLSL